MTAFHLQKPKGVTHCPPLFLYNLTACGTHRTCVGYSAQPSRAGHMHCIDPARWWHIQKSHRNSWRYHLVRVCFPGDREFIPATQYGHLWSWRSHGIWKRRLEGFPRNIFFLSLSFFYSLPLNWRYCIAEINSQSLQNQRCSSHSFSWGHIRTYFGIGDKVSDADFDLCCLKQGEVWAIQQHLC